MDMANLDFQKSGAFIVGLSDCDEKVTAAGGRVSTQEGTALEIWNKSQDAQKNANLIDKVTKSGHNSVVEHTYYNLVFQNVSAVVEQFLIEFRLAAFTVKSRRYVNFSDAGFFVPEFQDEKLKSRFKEHMASLFALYTEFVEAGVPKEDARFVLPYCLFSNFFCSVNGREFLHMLKAMIYGRGSRFPEIKALGLSLLEQGREKTPGIFKDFELRGENYQDDLDLSFLNIKRGNAKEQELVELLSFTTDAEEKIAKNALITKYGISTKEAEDICKDKDTVSKILEATLHSDRPRPLENAVYTLRYNGVTLSGITHFTRHRMQSLEVPSLTAADHSRYILPPSIVENAALFEKYKAAFAKSLDEYKAMQALGVKEEDLVYYLLSGNVMDILSTMNARELLLFLRLRTCTRAQWEIRAHAIKALQLLRGVSPDLFKFYGPSCFIDHCPEGRLSCGRMLEMKEFFKMK